MVDFFSEALPIMLVFLFGSVGEIITEKSGHLNMGTPGIMCLGGAGAIIGLNIYVDIIGAEAIVNNGAGIPILGIFLPLFFGILFAALAGLLFCFIVDTLRCNQNVTGLILTILGEGVLLFIGTIVYPLYDDLKGTAFTTVATSYFKCTLPKSFATANLFTEIVFNHGFLFYTGIAIALIAFFVIKYTRVGLSLRAVGENPGTSDASGVNVIRYRYVATLIGSAISGLGGVFYFLEKNTASSEFNIAQVGWIAVALVIFAMWNTGFSVIGSFLFAMCYTAAMKAPIDGVMKYIVYKIPFFITIVVLIIVSMLNKKETQPPTALGTTYFREDR